MNRRTSLSLGATALLALGSTLPASKSSAQQKRLKEQLAGTWTFVSAIDTNKDGTNIDRWRDNAKGLAIFDPTGHYSWLVAVLYG